MGYKNIVRGKLMKIIVITAFLIAVIVGVAFYWYPPLAQNDVWRDTERPFLPVEAEEVLEDKVNINTAAVSELTLLPGIGDKKAQAIIDYREAHGPFGSVEELLDVSGIGPKTMADIQDRITV